MRHYWLLQNLIAREIRARYLGSVSGMLWALLQPLALLAIYAFVFATIFQVRFPELENHRYVAFVAIALWPWQMLSDGLQRGTIAIYANSGLVQKVAFPREILVYANLASAWAIHLAGYVAVLGALVLFGESLALRGLPLVLLTLASLLLLTAALALVLAAVHVFLRDVEQILQPALMIVFYATPILYPVSMVPQNLRWLFSLNPIAYVAERLRAALLAGATPGWHDLALLVAACAALLLASWFFRRLAGHFEDYL